jgi:hypothetical protein
LLEEITDEGEAWGPRPFFVVLGEDTKLDPHKKNWRKILIVDPTTGRATFRSTTQSPTYKPRAEMRTDSEWVLDNSMMDANVNQARVFLAELESLLRDDTVPTWVPSIP